MTVPVPPVRASVMRSPVTLALVGDQVRVISRLWTQLPPVVSTSAVMVGGSKEGTVGSPSPLVCSSNVSIR